MGLAKTVRRRIESFGLPRRRQVRRALDFYGSRRCGWTVCTDSLSATSIVYSAGLGTDISFERALIDRFETRVLGIDPTPAALDWLRRQDVPTGLEILACALGGEDGTAFFSPNRNSREVSVKILPRICAPARAIELPVRRLSTLMGERGHERVDLLKLDIEGAEYAVIDEIVTLRLDVRQLLVEFHHRFPGVGRVRTTAAIRELNRAGYGIAHVSTSGREYTFVKG